MENIKEKISKLLALSKSTYEAEAQSALLKAQELMAEHKLTIKDFDGSDKANIVKRALNVTCTSMTNPWALKLATIVAKRYCCKCFLYRAKKGKKKTIAFVGLEEDFAICERAYLFAYEFVKARCKRLVSQNRLLGFVETSCREACNAYGRGFCLGLGQAFRKQAEQHTEWALVMAVPSIVEAEVSDMTMEPIYTKKQKPSESNAFLTQGFQAGLSYSPDPHLGKASNVA